MNARALVLPLAAALAAAPAAQAQDVLRVHEWGTFTSFAGANGVLLEFSTDPGKDLPSFVYTRDRAAALPSASRGKSAPSLQRMETPVIYFYTDAPREVEVEVKFPKGVLTEFYPRPRDFGPQASDPALEGGFLRWGKVRIEPEERGATLQLPTLAAGDDRAKAEHYLFARETKSALVRVCSEDGVRPAEAEKFLFYRGIGSFEAMRVRALGGGRVAIELKPCCGPSAIVLEVADDGRARLAVANLLVKDSQVQVALPAELRPANEVAAELENTLFGQLTGAGLFEDEARAMVKTWRASYFESPGLRVLYIMDRAFTDAVLPLTIKPAPDVLERVMLGRAEVLTPERERAIEEALRDGADAGALAARLGRYAAAAIERVVAMSADAEVKRRGQALLAEMKKQ